MFRNTNVALDDEDYQEVSQIKEELGLTWEGFIIEATECLEENQTSD